MIKGKNTVFPSLDAMGVENNSKYHQLSEDISPNANSRSNTNKPSWNWTASSAKGSNLTKETQNNLNNR